MVKAFNWHLGASGDELQEIALLRTIKAVHDLPEPKDLWRARRVAIVVGAGLQISNYVNK